MRLVFKAPADGLCDTAVWTEDDVHTWLWMSIFVASESGVFHTQTTACLFSEGYKCGYVGIGSDFQIIVSEKILLVCLWCFSSPFLLERSKVALCWEEGNSIEDLPL